MKWIFLLFIIKLYSVKPLASEHDDWLMNYYKAPNPQDFVFEVNKLRLSGLLHDPKHSMNISVFLSRILAAHPEKTKDWLDSFKGINGADVSTLFHAAWLANTNEAKEYLKLNGAIEALNPNPINYLTVKIKKPKTVEALWSYFYATGSTEPVRRIVSALNYAEYSGSFEAYQTSQKTNEDKRKAMLGSVFMAARWSLASNIRNASKVAAICEEILYDPNLTNDEELWLREILNKVQSAEDEMEQFKASDWRLDKY